MKPQPGALGLGLGVGSSFLPWDFTFRAEFFCLFSPDLVAQRGEKLELLIDKTENLVDSVSLGKLCYCTREQGGGDSTWRHLKHTEESRPAGNPSPSKLFPSCFSVWERSSFPLLPVPQPARSDTSLSSSLVPKVGKTLSLSAVIGDIKSQFTFPWKPGLKAAGCK